MKANIPLSRWRELRRNWKNNPNFTSFRQAMQIAIGQYWATCSRWETPVSY